MDNIFRSKGFVFVENIYIFLKKKQVDAKSEFYRTNMCKNIYFSNGTEINTLVESLAWEPSLELHFHLDIAFDSNFELGYIIRITLDITF